MLKRCLIIGAALLANAAWAQDDNPDAREHKDIPRMPGYYLYESNVKKFDAFEFTVRADADGNSVTEPKEGAVHTINYREKEGTEVSPLQIFRNYENAFKKAGGTLVWRDKATSNQAEGTFKFAKGKGVRWVSLKVYDEGDGYDFVVLDEQQMQQEIEVSAVQMADSLAKHGFIALYGIHFETGKDALQPDSEPLLAEIASLLKQQAKLKLSIEGHTDNVGSAQSNEALSQKRAEAVKRWLVGKGVDAKRLATRGHGPAMPIADNRLEEGRAKNRRVELVRN